MICIVIAALIVIFLAVVTVRTLCFTPKPQPELSREEVRFDRDAAVDALAQLVRCKTVSYNDHSLEDEAEFQKLISLSNQLTIDNLQLTIMESLRDEFRIISAKITAYHTGISRVMTQ